MRPVAGFKQHPRHSLQAALQGPRQDDRRGHGNKGHLRLQHVIDHGLELGPGRALLYSAVTIPLCIDPVMTLKVGIGEPRRNLLGAADVTENNAAFLPRKGLVHRRGVIASLQPHGF